MNFSTAIVALLVLVVFILFFLARGPFAAHSGRRAPVLHIFSVIQEKLPEKADFYKKALHFFRCCGIVNTN